MDHGRHLTRRLVGGGAGRHHVCAASMCAGSASVHRINEGHPTLRSYYQTSFVKQYEKADRLLRTETCENDTYHLAVGRRVENLPVLH